MRGHVDSETLAAYREGLLSRRKARQVAAHLAHCAQCAGLDAQLAELPALLARSPAPPMPAALTARIEAAIAAEAAARSETTDVAAAAASVTRDATRVTRDAAATRRHRKPRAPSPGRSRLVLRVAAAAAAVMVLAGGGYGLLRLLSGSTQHSFGTSAAAPASAQGAAGSGAHKAVSRSLPSAGMAPLNKRAGPRVVTSGTNYQPARLKAQVRAALARFAVKAAGPNQAAPSVTAGPSGAFFNVTACLRRVAGGRYVQLVDLAYYEGKPAAIIVIRGPGANEETVRVVAPGCSATANDQIFSTLLPTGG
jgi:hypothetical protein